MVREDPENSQPEFPGTAARFVPENTPEHKYVGDPVTATDANSGDVLTYSLDGADEDSFYIAPITPTPTTAELPMLMRRQWRARSGSASVQIWTTRLTPATTL